MGSTTSKDNCLFSGIPAVRNPDNSVTLKFPEKYMIPSFNRNLPVYFPKDSNFQEIDGNLSIPASAFNPSRTTHKPICHREILPPYEDITISIKGDKNKVKTASFFSERESILYCGEVVLNFRIWSEQEWRVFMSSDYYLMGICNLKFQGSGTLCVYKGIVTKLTYQGNFSNNKLNGNCKITENTGEKITSSFEGNFKDGYCHGKYTDDNIKQEGKFIAGYLHTGTILEKTNDENEGDSNSKVNIYEVIEETKFIHHRILLENRFLVVKYISKKSFLVKSVLVITLMESRENDTYQKDLSENIKDSRMAESDMVLFGIALMYPKSVQKYLTFNIFPQIFYLSGEKLPTLGSFHIWGLGTEKLCKNRNEFTVQDLEGISKLDKVSEIVSETISTS